MNNQKTQDKSENITSIIRPEILIDDIRMRGQEMSSSGLRKLKKGLRTFHSLETMAVNIYRFQITGKVCELNRQLIAAMCNEMTHLQDFQIKLFEYGWKPGKLGWIYCITGFMFGFFSRLKGTRAILKTGIWVETKAVNHYEELLKTIDWDEDTRKMIEKNQSDEFEHINRWEKFLNSDNY